jgi:hypothetical protein
MCYTQCTWLSWYWDSHHYWLSATKKYPSATGSIIVVISVGTYVHVLDICLNAASSCDYLEHVTILCMWLSCACDYLEHVTILSVWLSCACDYLEHVTILSMWLSCACDYLVHVTILSMWLSWACDYLEHVTIWIHTYVSVSNTSSKTKKTSIKGTITHSIVRRCTYCDTHVRILSYEHFRAWNTYSKMAHVRMAEVLQKVLSILIQAYVCMARVIEHVIKRIQTT